MKKLVFVLSLLMICNGLSFAEESAENSSPAEVSFQAGAGEEAKKDFNGSYIGKVQLVTLADEVKGTESEIAVADETGIPFTYGQKMIKNIFDEDGSTVITLDKIKTGDKVEVNYTIKEDGRGDTIVNSIRLIKE